MAAPPSRSTRKVRLLAYLVIFSLVVGLAYALQRQGSSSLQNKELEAGIIESGNTPALYFNLRNLGQDTANYTYVVSYNSTDRGEVTEGSTVTVPAGKTFSYSISLVRPASGVMVASVRIYGGDYALDARLLYDQSWTIRANV